MNDNKLIEFKYVFLLKKSDDSLKKGVPCNKCYFYIFENESRFSCEDMSCQKDKCFYVKISLWKKFWIEFFEFIKLFRLESEIITIEENI